MKDTEYYRIREYAMYGEPAWWGILCIEKEKKGRALLLSGLQGELKIFLNIEKISEKKKYTDTCVKNFTGKILYAEEVEFPAKKMISDLREKLTDWINDKSSESFKSLSKDIQTYNDEISPESYFNSVRELDKVPTRDPWAYFRYYWSDKKSVENYESFFFNDEEELYAEDSEDGGEPGSFQLEKI